MKTKVFSYSSMVHTLIKKYNRFKTATSTIKQHYKRNKALRLKL